MKWISLKSEEQLEEIKASGKTAIVFKHSTRCSTSLIAKRNFELDWDEERLGNVPAYYLDLLNYREISGKIAAAFGVQHESPQVLLISKGECLYNASHSAISVEDITRYIDN